LGGYRSKVAGWDDYMFATLGCESLFASIAACKAVHVLILPPPQGKEKNHTPPTFFPQSQPISADGTPYIFSLYLTRFSRDQSSSETLARLGLSLHSYLWCWPILNICTKASTIPLSSLARVSETLSGEILLINSQLRQNLAHIGLHLDWPWTSETLGVVHRRPALLNR